MSRTYNTPSGFAHVGYDDKPIAPRPGREPSRKRVEFDHHVKDWEREQTFLMWMALDKEEQKRDRAKLY